MCLFSRTHPVFSQSSFIVGLCLLLFVLYIFYLAEDSFCQCLLLLLEQKIWLWMSPVFFHLFGSHFKSRLFQTPTLSFSYIFQFFFKLQSLMHWPSKSLCRMNSVKMFLQRLLFSGYCSCPLTDTTETHTKLRRALKSDLLR